MYIIDYQRVVNKKTIERRLIQNMYPHKSVIICVLIETYRFIALAPKTPAKAEATAITTFRIISHTDFFIAIIYLLSVL